MTTATAPERDRLLEHDYDGIREYDNPLPSWWVWLFVGTFVFSVGYYAYYELGPGPTIIAEYEADVRLAAEQDARRAPVAAAVAGMPSDASLKALQANAAVMAGAREMYGARCAACHGPQGQGVIGPNLADDYWLHGGKLTDILATITNGVPDKGMIPWKGQLKPSELEAMAAYVGTLHGTHPPNPKAPQGDKIPGA